MAIKWSYKIRKKSERATRRANINQKHIERRSLKIKKENKMFRFSSKFDEQSFFFILSLQS